MSDKTELDIRDHFALEAMKCILHKRNTEVRNGLILNVYNSDDEKIIDIEKNLCEEAYIIADKMLEAREGLSDDR